MPPKKRKPRPLPTKKEREACPHCVKRGMTCPGCIAKTLKADAFPRPMGVPCVDLSGSSLQIPTRPYDLANRFPPTTSEMVAMHDSPSTSLVISWRKWWTELRFQSARGVLWLARTIRRLAWRIAP